MAGVEDPYNSDGDHAARLPQDRHAPASPTSGSTHNSHLNTLLSQWCVVRGCWRFGSCVVDDPRPWCVVPREGPRRAASAIVRIATGQNARMDHCPHSLVDGVVDGGEESIAPAARFLILCSCSSVRSRSRHMRQGSLKAPERAAQNAASMVRAFPCKTCNASPGGASTARPVPPLSQGVPLATGFSRAPPTATRSSQRPTASRASALAACAKGVSGQPQWAR